MSDETRTVTVADAALYERIDALLDEHAADDAKKYHAAHCAALPVATAGPEPEMLPIASVKALVEDSINRAYERGHADGINCDANTGFGIVDCDHVQPGTAAALRVAAAQADGGEAAVDETRALRDFMAAWRVHRGYPPTGYDDRDEVLNLARVYLDPRSRAAQADTAPGGGER
jgi:hypothetical protein